MQEKSNKKVSRACNTCRLKRKKCDGLEPCFFCTENKLECSYSREPRRRGPPSGYLRYTETRVALLETLLGLYIARNSGNTPDPFLEEAESLLTESKTCTQDVWDGHKASWIASASSKVVEDLAMFFAPFHRVENEQTSKPLLPTAGSVVKPNPSLSPAVKSMSTTLPSSDPLLWPHPHRPGTPTQPHRDSLTFNAPQLHVMSRESFERTRDVATSFLSPTGEQTEESPGPQKWPSGPLHRGFSDVGFGISEGSSKSASSSQLQLHPSNSSTLQHYESNNVQIPTSADSPMMDIEPESSRSALLANAESENVYTGSYWRTAELALTGSPKTRFFDTPTTDGIDLPPPHILSNLIDVYYQHVYPSFPFLPPRSTLETRVHGSMPSTNSGGLNTMLLALCAYSGRLSPSLDSTTSGSILGGTGEAGKVAADLWYEQSRTAVSADMKKGSSVETVQTLLLLSLRDHGRGFESQAWLLVGLAVRMAQDLDLNEDDTNANRLDLLPEDRQTRRNIWGVSSMLDLFLSLQLGRPPAIMDALRPTGPPHSNTWQGDVAPASLIPELTPTIQSQTLFAHTIALCHIMARINFHFYLGFSSAEAQPQTEKLLELKTELDMWQHTLPHKYRISIGHQPEREVLEVNMLYHVAIILLYRPFSKNKSMQQAADVFLEAASTFNVLLEKYRQSQSFSPSSNSPHTSPSLTFSNPNMIYLIFTVSIAHLSGFKLRQQQQAQSNHAGTNRSTTMALQTQLHLLNCLEALTSISGTWELARRCWRTLDKLMDTEGLKPKPAAPEPSRNPGSVEGVGLGKRKRDSEGEDTELGGSSRLPPTTGHFWGGQERTINPPVSHGVDVSSFPQSGINQSQALMGWNPSSGGDLTDHSVLASMPISADSFDLGAFASARWLPEVLNVPEAIPVGLDGVWDGEWDEGFWAQSLHFSLDGGG